LVHSYVLYCTESRSLDTFLQVLYVRHKACADLLQVRHKHVRTVDDFVYQIVDFDDDGRAGGLIHEWVKISMRDLIDSVVPESNLVVPASLIAVSSVYLKAKW
jgi:serine protease inhibitor